jgi:hypothetical protein
MTPTAQMGAHQIQCSIAVVRAKFQAILTLQAARILSPDPEAFQPDCGRGPSLCTSFELFAYSVSSGILASSQGRRRVRAKGLIIGSI